VTFHLKAQLAAAEDQTIDPAKPWPDDRKIVELGTLTVDKVVADSATAEKALLFLPGQVTDGIELSDDPMVSIRDGAYAESFSRRSQ
jgi:catalase